MAKTVKAYLEAHDEWAAVLAPLREVLLSAGLDETVKWGMPVYCAGGRNVAGIGAFKAYAGLWFFDGALLADPDGVLVNAQQGKTRALRQWRFAAGDAVDRDRVRAYVEEAVALVRDGRRVAPRAAKPVAPPAELEAALANDAELREAFEALTPGRRRAWAEHIGSARREGTRRARLEKAIPLILAGKGLDDRYRR